MLSYPVLTIAYVIWQIIVLNIRTGRSPTSIPFRLVDIRGAVNKLPQGH
jgi:hypothetical protein